MRKRLQLLRLLKTSSNIGLLLWIVLCLLLYLSMPDSPRLVAQQSTIVDADAAYSEDSQRLIDLGNFTYLIEQPPCLSHTQAVIMVHSAPPNIEKRSVIRETWGQPSLMSGNSSLRLLFVFGAVKDEQLQSSLVAEQAVHGDLLQGNFVDAYFNLTYKHVMALKWFHTRCERAQLLVKVDDDIYLNTPQLYQHLNGATLGDSPLSALFQSRGQLLLCAINYKDRVARSYSSKWRVSFREYAGHYYPPFCPGFAVFYSTDVVRRLYVAAQRSSFFKLDDVLITGLLASRTNITLTDLTSNVIYPDRLKLLLSGHIELEKLNFLVSWHKMSAQQLKGLWKLYGAAN